MGSIYDVLGVGFGPANLALAVCLEEEAEDGRRDFERLFLEVKPCAVWHPGMLLEDSLIQISVLKDLATVRNPRSRFTFLNYLQTRGRLFEFLNLRDLFPTRIEFNDYLTWVAAELGQRVRYGKEVVAVEPVAGEGGQIDLLRVVVRDLATGGHEEHLTRHLALATGGVPRVPQGITLSPGGHAFHSHQFKLRMERDFPERGSGHGRGQRFLVVGAGQSAAELFCYLLQHYPEADVTAAIRHFSYKPVDDSDFTNEIFFPQMVDLLFELAPEKRRLVLDDCRDVNYAVVDLPLIRRIYRCLYEEKVQGKARARIRPFLELLSLEERDQEVVAEFHDLLRDRPVTLAAEALVLATGYSWCRRHPLLASLAPYLETDETGQFRIERDYRLAARPGFLPRIYLQGFSEDVHGASETVLSLLPMRAGDIVRSLAAAPAPAATPATAATPAPAAAPALAVVSSAGPYANP